MYRGVGAVEKPFPCPVLPRQRDEVTAAGQRESRKGSGGGSEPPKNWVLGVQGKEWRWNKQKGGPEGEGWEGLF